MDCRSALEKLEVVRPGSDDLADPELAEAKAYLESSDVCQAAFRKRQALDREIGRGMRDIPVPSGLKGDLLAALDLAGAATGNNGELESIAPENSEQAKPSKRTAVPIRRRRVLQISAATAACLIAGFAALFFFGSPDDSTITLADLRESVPLQLAVLDGPPDLPAGFPSEGGVARQLQQFGISKPAAAKGFQPEGFSKKVAAVYPFRVAVGHRRPAINGILLVIPEKFVTDSPGTSSFDEASTVYLKSGTHATVAWKSDGYVYMCVVPVGDLDRLREALQPQFA